MTDIKWQISIGKKKWFDSEEGEGTYQAPDKA